MNRRTICIIAAALCFLPGCKSASKDKPPEPQEAPAQKDSEALQMPQKQLPACESDDDKYVCINNEWLCLSDKRIKFEEDEQYCGGVALSTIVQNKEGNHADPVKVNDKLKVYDVDGNAYSILEMDQINENEAEIKLQNDKDKSIKSYYYEDLFYDSFLPYHSKAYQCRYGHWVCYEKDGCDCFDGNNNRTVAFGEICENTNNSCKDSKQPPMHLTYDKRPQDDEDERYELEIEALKGNAAICMQDSCPCGDGACMKYGVCDGGVCKCGTIETNNHDEFFCTMYFHYEPGDATYEVDDNGGILICTKPGGCHTRDGKHFPQWSTIGHALLGHYLSDKTPQQYDLPHKEMEKFHIDAGFDTTLESTSIYGECVLDRTDGLMRMSQANGAASFVCDQQACTCGNESCRIGEICDQGKCRTDDCKAHAKNDRWHDIDIDEGITHSRFFEEKVYIKEGEKLPNGIKTDDIKKDENGSYYRLTGRAFYLNPGTEYYSSLLCEGGHRYCHGKNNAPIPAPDKADGYQCLDVTSLPNIDAKDHLKTWVCMNQNGCACGESQCKYAESCMNKECLSIPRSPVLCNGAPLQDGYECFGNDFHVGQRCIWESCSCGKMKCNKGEYCNDEQCFKSFAEYYYDDEDF